MLTTCLRRLTPKPEGPRFRLIDSLNDPESSDDEDDFVLYERLPQEDPDLEISSSVIDNQGNSDPEESISIDDIVEVIEQIPVIERIEIF